ncbi:MAG: maleylpyruvate isomerase N-terminal domain-containing protein [Ilumatobacteraceae bacterium]
MNDLDRDRAGATRAHAAVIADLRDLRSDQVSQPSLLPGWTVGHVATHIARNADGHTRMLEAAMRGQIEQMYPGGHDRRRVDIESGAARSADELLVDVVESAARLEATWAAMQPEAWAGRGVTITGEMTARELLFARWREVIVHHADLGLGYSWSDWDDEYVRLDLGRLCMLWASRKPMGLTDLPSEAIAVPPRHRVAWLLGRAEIDGLDPAGIMG